MNLAGSLAAMVAIRNLQTVVSLGKRSSSPGRRHKRQPIDYEAVPDCDDPDALPFVIDRKPSFDQSV